MSEWLFLQNGFAVYVGLFVLLMGGAVGLPIPEDVPLILAGILAHRGNGKLQFIFLTCYVGIIVGDLIIFSIGRKLGAKISNKNWFNTRISPAALERTKRALEKRSLLTILLARHLFYLRTVTFLACGAVRMSYSRFILADAFAALISASVMMALGFYFSENMDEIFHLLQKTKYLSLGAIIVVLFGVAWYLKMRRPKDEGDVAE